MDFFYYPSNFLIHPHAFWEVLSDGMDLFFVSNFSASRCLINHSNQFSIFCFRLTQYFASTTVYSIGRPSNFQNICQIGMNLWIFTYRRYTRIEWSSPPHWRSKWSFFCKSICQKYPKLLNMLFRCLYEFGILRPLYNWIHKWAFLKKWQKFRWL